MGAEKVKPRILALDIETFPMKLLGFSLYDQNFGLNQIEKDWTIASWAAKIVGESRMYYEDVFRKKHGEADILPGIHKLLGSVDVILTQNGKSFDIPKLNAKFIEHGLDPLPDLEHIDTKRMAKGRFKFTSNSLEYLCRVLKTNHQKLKHNRFPGMDLWRECLLGNPLAWKDMQKYNKHDVYCLEDVYLKLRPWGIKIDLNKYTKEKGPACSICTGTDLKKDGFAHKGQARYQRYRCNECNALVRGKDNLLSRKKKKAIRPGA